MASPLVSFVVTYHNEPEALLSACLQSIRSLSLAEGEAEIIVVDDGKTLSGFPRTPSDSPLKGEDSLPFREGLEGSLPSWEGQEGAFPSRGGMEGLVLVRQEQAGLSVARNTGIAHSQGRYIQFVDADDQLVPSAYEAVISQMRKDEADVILFRMTRSGVKPSPVRPPRPVSPADFLLLRNLRAGACGYAFRRETLGDLRFFPGLVHEDELFTPQLFLRAETLCELDVAAYFYRQHAGTITSRKDAGWIQKRLDDIHFIIGELRRLDEPLLERRIRQLTADYLQEAWTLTHRPGELRRRLRELRREGLLPLPLRCYSPRYLLLAIVSSCPCP